MLERTLLKLSCPLTGSLPTGLEVFEERVINGVKHIYSGNIVFKDSKYPIKEGIVCFGTSSSVSLYDNIWKTNFEKLKNNQITYDDLRREKLLTLLGCKTLGWLSKKSFLDVGSGFGRFSLAAVEMGADVIALDSSLEGLKISFSLLSDKLNSEQFARVDFVQTNIMDNVFVPASFDIVFSAYVLHHTQDTKEALKVVSKYVKPNGCLAVTVFTPESGHSPLLWVFRSFIMDIPAEGRQRIIGKLGILSVDGVKPVINMPEILNKLSSDPDLANFSSGIKLRDLLQPETISTDYIWIQSQGELSQWFNDLGFCIEYQLGETTVGRLGKATLIDRFKRMVLFQRARRKLVTFLNTR
jgi:2-polyprenyl-3-methyl-5-hydroxy-6-metoxy-1,4-benzoquinol methylase